jgi:uncharacterized protein (DUF4213/DUF364 family)
MSILDDLLASLDDDAPIRDVRVCVHWTAVLSRRCGLASSLTDDSPHAHRQVRDAGRLHGLTACELAQRVKSDYVLEASIGMAAINSLLHVDESRCVELNAGRFLEERGRGKQVALVGHFPFIPQLRAAAGRLWVLEQRPAPGEFPADAAPEIIPQADVVAITGTTLINGTFDGLIRLCRPGALVLVLGPSTPLSPVLFDYGVDVISGAQVVDAEATLRTISQGATFRQVEGVRLLTMSRVDPAKR